MIPMIHVDWDILVRFATMRNHLPRMQFYYRPPGLVGVQVLVENQPTGGAETRWITIDPHPVPAIVQKTQDVYEILFTIAMKALAHEAAEAFTVQGRTGCLTRPLDPHANQAEYLGALSRLRLV